MGIGKLIGGILALAAGAMILIGLFLWMNGDGVTLDMPIAWWNIASSAVAIVGGILGLLGKKIGGILALIVGALWIIGGILAITYVTIDFVALSVTLYYWIYDFTYVVSIEAIIAIVGGILLLVSSSD